MITYVFLNFTAFHRLFFTIIPCSLQLRIVKSAAWKSTRRCCEKKVLPPTKATCNEFPISVTTSEKGKLAYKMWPHRTKQASFVETWTLLNKCWQLVGFPKHKLSQYEGPKYLLCLPDCQLNIDNDCSSTQTIHDWVYKIFHTIIWTCQCVELNIL